MEFTKESYNIMLMKIDAINGQEERMKKRCCMIAYMLMAGMLLVGCDRAKDETESVQETGSTEMESETELEEIFVSAEEDEYVPVIEEVFSEETPYQELADYLSEYYQIPEEYQIETRYYYNYIDINDDGMMEVFTVVIGEYTEAKNGNPAVILSVDEAGEFVVLESFPSVRTPITISEETTNGWHDIIYYAYGGDEDDGYRICRYSPEGGYKTDLSEIVKELEPVSGTQILSNNLIDDMDQGKYLTLGSQVEKSTE